MDIPNAEITYQGRRHPSRIKHENILTTGALEQGERPLRKGDSGVVLQPMRLMTRIARPLRQATSPICDNDPFDLDPDGTQTCVGCNQGTSAA